MKKKIIIGSSIFLILLVAFVCVSLAPRNTKSLDQEVVFWTLQMNDFTPYMTDIITKFEYENPDIKIKWIDAETVTYESANKILSDCDGILIPGGFGDRGIEGMVCAANYARINNIPYLGICLGMQIAVIEFARNVLKMKNANSTEFDKFTSYPVIDLMIDQYGNIPLGGTMRLGAYPCKIKPNTMMELSYGKLNISERHRHRYEFNNKYKEKFIYKGMIIGGTSPDEQLVEAVEISNNDFFVGVQYHPEFKSRPNRANPIIKGFIKATVNK